MAAMRNPILSPWTRAAALGAGLWLLGGAAQAATSTFGQTGDGPSYFYHQDGLLVGCKYHCTVDGNVTALNVALSYSGWGYAIDMALYSNGNDGSHDYPYQLLVASGARTLYNNSGWYNFPVAATQVQANQDYWICSRTDDPNIYEYEIDLFTTGVTDSYKTQFFANSWSSGYPASFDPGTRQYNDPWDLSMYADVTLYTPTRTGTPTRTSTISPTPTLTPTASVSPTITPTRTITLTRTPSCTATPLVTPTATPRATPTATPAPVPDLTGNQLLVYPVPVRSGMLSLTFLAAAPGRAEFVIYDSAYHVVATFSRDVAGSGANTVTWPVDALAPGVYLCRLTLSAPAGRNVFPPAKFVKRK